MAICECFSHDIQTAFSKGLISQVELARLQRELCKTRDAFCTRRKLIGADKMRSLILLSKLALLQRGNRILICSLPRDPALQNVPRAYDKLGSDARLITDLNRPKSF